MSTSYKLKQLLNGQKTYVNNFKNIAKWYESWDIMWHYHTWSIFF